MKKPNWQNRKSPYYVRTEDLELLKARLLAERAELLAAVSSNDDQETGSQRSEVGDEADAASAESESILVHRLRDRERILLKKIDKSLKRIADGTFNICESCGVPIGIKRLLARPVSVLCISCKEEQERDERGFADPVPGGLPNGIWE